MKQRKRIASKFIGFDKDAPTAWQTLLVLVLIVLSFSNIALAFATHVDAAGDRAAIAEKEATLKEVQDEVNKQTALAELRFCESSNNDHAKGDGGESVGPYQVQKPTLEDMIGRKVSYQEYYSIVTDYERIHPIVYESYFEKGESWRWKVCTKKINAKYSWKF